MAKRLYRSKNDRVLAGVCGGLAEYFNVDPVAVRVGFVLAIGLLGLSFWVYPILWLIIPEEGETKSKLQEIIEDAEIINKKDETPKNP